jgi:hypothetical protein
MSEMTRLLRFGAGARVYNFPAEGQRDYVDNFLRGESYIVRTAGMDGGIDQARGLPAPRESGLIQAEITLLAPTRANMTALRDTLKRMQRWGLQRLTMITSDESGTDFPAERYCWAKIIDAQMREERGQHTDLWQPVVVALEVPDPRWYSWAGMEYWGDGSEFDDGGNWPGPRVSEAVGDGDEVALENEGTALTPALLRLNHAANTVENLTVRLLGESGETISGFRYKAVAGDGEMLIVDAGIEGGANRIVIDRATGMESGWPDFEILGGMGFILLEPGENVIRINGDFSGDVTLEVEFAEAWA